MSHVVLARKYRPRSFEQMVGQTHVVQALTNALESGRLHHAYLFTGTRGIGKTTVSRILAKSLNCTGPDGTGGVTAHPCGVCQACTEIDADRYIDYIEMDAASNGGKDEIRELIERAAYKPGVARFKVFMIDEAHQLTKDAFNALLKTLEEPPEYLKFVLATTDPEKMLPTVLSRCLQFNLRPMAPEVVHEHLQQVLAAEAVLADAGALRLLARAARGSMRDALSLTDQAIAYGGGTLQEAGVRAMLGSVDRSHALKLVEALAARDGVALLATLAGLRELGLSPSGTLEELAGLLQQMAVEQAVPGALDAADPDTAGARALAAVLPPDETQLLYSLVLHGRPELSLVSDDHAALSMVLLRFLAFPPAADGAPVPAPAASRAASLVATPPQARSSTPARPAAAMPARVPLPPNAPSAPSAPSAPNARAVTVAVAVAAPAVAPAAAPAHGARSAQGAAPDRAAAAASGRSHASPQAAPRLASAADQPPPWIDDDLPESETDSESGIGQPAHQPDDQPDDEPQRHDRASVALAREPAPGALGVPPAERALAAARPDAAEADALKPTLLGQQWCDLLRPLVDGGAVAALVRELALQAELVAVQPLAAGGRCWRLRVARETLRATSLSAKLAAALQQALGEPVALELEAGEPQDSMARRDAVQRAEAQRRAEQQIRSDPTVQALMAQFPTARIVPGSIKPVAPAADS